MNTLLSSPKVVRRSFSGFTLIELLVVIAIIAILAAILFPVFARVREKARQTACLSNEKQMATGLMQYVQDYDETLPRQNYGTNATTSPKWMDMIYPYINSEEVFTCPSATNTYGPAQAYMLQFVNYYRLPGRAASYGTYNVNSSYYQTSPAPCGVVPVTAPIAFGKSVQLSKLAVPSDTIMITEGVQGAGNSSISWATCAANPVLRSSGFTYNGVSYPVATLGSTAATPVPLVLMRHNGGANVIWCDGHAKWTTAAEISAIHVVSGQNVMYHWSVEED